jgi:hypothetical protein
MDRRTYLAALGLATAGLAGCQTRTAPRSGNGSTAGTGSGQEGTGGAAAGTVTGQPPDSAAFGDVDLPIPRSELVRGAPRDAIPAITDPVFAADWSDIYERSEQYNPILPEGMELRDEDIVVGVTRGGEARAYPLKILNWHEIVNDELDGPLLVTYCPLCGSGVTAERRVAGEVTEFGVSGFLFNSDLVMYDDLTGSLWSQIMATAINGERTGDTLSLLPSSFTTWGDWQSQYPETTVLLPPPISDTVRGRVVRGYTFDPYEGYDRSDRVGVGANDSVDDRMHPKTTVLGVTDDELARAYTLETVRQAGVVNDTVGDLPVAVTNRTDALFAYDRRVDGQTLTFERADDRHLRAGGSRWQIISGQAVDGPFEGTRLEQANDRSQMFWFAWADFHPETEIYDSG